MADTMQELKGTYFGITTTTAAEGHMGQRHDTITTPNNTTQVRQQLACLENAIDRATGLSDAMRDRLSTVLTSLPPAKSLEKHEAETSIVSLAATIRDYANRIVAIGDALDDVIGRLEL